MIPVGYMAKKIPKRAEIYSVSACVNDDFAEYIDWWKHNGWWFFDTPEIIRSLAREHSVDLEGTLLFYYEVHELEFDNGIWRPFSPWKDSWKDSQGVVLPLYKRLEGYDVVTFWVENSPAPEHSPLSCNSVAAEVQTNSHCLFDTFEGAQEALITGKFTGCEPGALRIFAVYSVDWP
jgi:hypothetical protein